MATENLVASILALQSIIDQSEKTVFFGGAGVSTESGLPDFRSANGVYSQQYRYPPETMLSRGFLYSHPEEFYAFYRTLLAWLSAEPNAAHRKLAEMEAAGRLQAVITQNIDGLHQRAGSRKVLELHGNSYRNYCLECRKPYEYTHLLVSTGIPRCSCGGMIRPDVVLYQENLDPAVMREAGRLVAQADTLIIGGTSLVVYPAAGLANRFHGRHLVIINQSGSQLDHDASLVIHGPIGAVMDQLRV